MTCPLLWVQSPEMTQGVAVDDAAVAAGRQAVGQCIKRRRIRKVGPQLALAELLGITQGKVSKMERGLLEPNHADRARLVTILGGKVSDYRAAP